jgi:hypothetical protein
MMRLSIALAAVGLVSGCASTSKPAAKVPATDAKTYEGTFSTLAAAGDAAGGSIVQSTSTGGTPQTVVTNLASGRSTVLPTGKPLYAIATWVTLTDIGVVGANCPTWINGDAPQWDDDSQQNVPERCGDTAYEVWLVDRSSGIARRIDPIGLGASNGYVVVDVRGGKVLLRGKGERGFGLVTVDLQSAAVSQVPTTPGTSGAAEASTQVCLDSSGRPFGVVSWTGLPPAGVADAGLDARAITTAGGTSISAILASSDKTWKPVALTAKPEAFDGVAGCGPAGIWRVGRSGGAQIDLVAGTAQVEAIPPVLGDGQGAESNVAAPLGSGPPLLAVQATPSGDSPDARRPATTYIWDDGKWTQSTSVGLGPSSFPFINGGVVDALVMSPGKYPLKADLA